MRRLRRLEKQLKIPPEDRAWCERELRKADVVTVRAKRIHHRASSLKLDTSGNVLNKTTPGVDSYFRKAVGDGLQMVEDEKPPEVSIVPSIRDPVNDVTSYSPKSRKGLPGGRRARLCGKGAWTDRGVRRRSM